MKLIKSTIIFLVGLAVPLMVMAATTDFTADSDVTVTGVTFGAGTADMLILNGSTAESWTFDSGTFTVTNPGTFNVGSANAAVKTIKITGAGTGCAVNTTPGVSSLAITGAGTYTITPSTDTSCAAATCPTLVHAVTYNASPTCGAASCEAGYRVLGTGATATCVLIGGGGGGGGGTFPPVIPPVTPPIIYSGQSLGGQTIRMGGSEYLFGASSTLFYTVVTSSHGIAQNHGLKVVSIDNANNKVVIEFMGGPTVTLSVGETKQVDLDGDGINDISVKLNSLPGDKADITLTRLITTVTNNGLLIKVACPTNSAIDNSCRSLYYVGNDGQRYVFPNEKTYKTWYSDFAGVKTISLADLALYPVGGNVTYRPGINMVKITLDTAVYVVAKGGVLLKIKDETDARALYGTGWQTLVKDIPTTFFMNYTKGAELSSPPAYDKAAAIAASPTISIDKGL